MATKWCTKLDVAWKRCAIVFQGHPSNCKVTRLKKIVDFDPNWAFPDCNSNLNSPMATKWWTKLEVALKRCPIVFQGHPPNFKVTWGKKSSILTRTECFRTVTPVWIHWWIEMMHKVWCSIEEVPCYFLGSSIKFQGHTGWKIDDLNPIWVRLLGRSQLSNPSDLPCLNIGHGKWRKVKISLFSFSAHICHRFAIFFQYICFRAWRNWINWLYLAYSSTKVSKSKMDTNHGWWLRPQ